MFKKNPTRPTINIALKRTSQGYRVVPNEAFQLYTTKKIVRSIYRPDLIQMSTQHIEGVGNAGSLTAGTIIQPPSHVTLPSVASWFKEDEIHQIQKEYFPEYFRPEVNTQVSSFSVKNSNLYFYYRNSMIFMWRENAKKYLSPSLCRKNLLGDVSSIMRIHAFLENWGLINFPSKQHNKGILLEKPESLVCYVCENCDSESFYVAEIEEILFQICQYCFNSDSYPQSIKKAEFRKVLYENHANSSKQLDRSQTIRMLEIINGIPNGVPKDKDRDTWSVIQKEFPQISKEKILKAFLKIPLTMEMNSHIFENNEDNVTCENVQRKKQIEEITQPSVFEDFQNPILGSLAYMNFLIKKYQERVHAEHFDKEHQETVQIDQIQIQDELQKAQTFKQILKASQVHSKSLCEDQQRKIKDLTKMLIEVVLSRLELKSLFISEYQRLVHAEEEVSRNLVKNGLAESLKINLKQFKQNSIDQNIDPFQNDEYKEKPDDLFE